MNSRLSPVLSTPCDYGENPPTVDYHPVLLKVASRKVGGCVVE